MQNIQSQIAQILLKYKAVTINVQDPYTYSSGIRSPIYCDNRLLISIPSVRKEIVTAFCERIRPYNPKQIAGVATAGISWGAWIAQEMNLPFVYVRPKPKGHGKGKQIEGSAIQDATILIEDLLSTGQSSVQALDAMREENVSVVGLFAIFTYGFSSAEALFKEKKIHVETLTNLEQLLKEGIGQKYFDETTQSEVLRWQKDPQNWYQGK